jgi:peptidoglycan/LPS O-acetylase OafA/YrhL
MLQGMIMLASSTLVSGGALGDFLSKWEEAGLFSYLLPFLIIFAMIFGILTKMKIFKESKAVNAIIALAVALMALQFGFVTDFFSQIFPRLGVGLAIILGVLIVTGLFADKDSNVINYVLLGIGVITIAIVIVQSAGALGWSSGQWWQDNWQLVVGAIVIFILVAIVIGSNPNPKREPPTYKPNMYRD